MKILFISMYDITADHVKGIRKKIEAQVKYFNENCESVDWIYKNSNNCVMKNNKVLFEGYNHKKEMISTYMDYKKLKEYINPQDYDFVYIRYIIGNMGLLDFVKYAKLNNTKTLIEIPTYPYLDEINKNLEGYIKRKLDDYITKNLYKYVYRIVCTNKDTEIFRIKTISIDNGVDLEKIKCVSKRERDNNIINAIAVASICKWHGFDRFIKSMDEYRKNHELKLYFYIVGNGRKEDLEYLKKLVKEYSLENFVIFTGVKEGKELDELYEKMDFAVSSLALFRAGGGHNPIKTKEYVAKGLPVVTGYDDSVVNSNLDYIYKVSENESVFPMDDILNWYKNGHFSNYSIREYAEKNVSWDIQIKKILKEFKKDIDTI